MKRVDFATIEQLPVHDAEVLRIELGWIEGGPALLSLTLDVRIHEDEDCSVFAMLGVNGRDVRISFYDIEETRAEFHRPACPWELLDDWKPEYIRSNGDSDSEHTSRYEIHRLVFISGSALTVKCAYCLIGAA